MTGRCQFTSLDWEPAVHAHPVMTGPISLTPRPGRTVDSVRGKMGSLYQKAKSLFTTTSLDPAILECRQHGYILLGKSLGSGSYAKVILAEVTAGVLLNNKALESEVQQEGHNKVAVKIILKAKGNVKEEEYIRKFVPREITAMRKLSAHDNVIRLYDQFDSSARRYLVMQYASNGDMLGFINKWRAGSLVGLPEAVVRRFLRQILSGLNYCHEQRVVHRDLKCENILLDGHYIVKITDFGFATTLERTDYYFDDSVEYQYLSTFCGSYAYAAPEIIRGQKYQGEPADIWSVGVIYYAMLCGEHPYKDSYSGKSHGSALLKQMERPIKFSPFTSADAMDVAYNILVQDWTKRPSAAQLLQHAWLQGDDLPAKDITATLQNHKKKMTKRGKHQAQQTLPDQTGAGQHEPGPAGRTGSPRRQASTQSRRPSRTLRSPGQTEPQRKKQKPRPYPSCPPPDDHHSLGDRKTASPYRAGHSTNSSYCDRQSQDRVRTWRPCSQPAGDRGDLTGSSARRQAVTLSYTLSGTRGVTVSSYPKDPQCAKATSQDSKSGNDISVHGQRRTNRQVQARAVIKRQNKVKDAQKGPAKIKLGFTPHWTPIVANTTGSIRLGAVRAPPNRDTSVAPIVLYAKRPQYLGGSLLPPLNTRGKL
ncbi:testis-specific serine/threonine-protein kinase 5-like [Branchiostoma floridae]|uniref:non-specific serine/threonine protein kinase n=1 Tax=Branchiostoma floridae TaxID=7739 RepID=A0A9J7M117_BRAFL|nr:testis-specific serine/threonine-protein kinase 5-like [Branchiostoma floridae]